jgi:hypothetical protein
VQVELLNGKYRRTMTTTVDAGASGTYGSVYIPGIEKRNFCLVFDAQMLDSSSEAGIVIIARAVNYDSNDNYGFYYINLIEDGSGKIFYIYSESNEKHERLIGEINKDTAVLWRDKSVHTVKISFQDSVLEIYEGQSSNPMYRQEFVGDDLFLDLGRIRLGTKLFKPNATVTVEFDNVFVYDKCP